MSEQKSRYRVAVQLSPLCRITEFNLAEDLIRNGLETGNVSDWVQQSMGLASSVQTNSLTLQHIQASLNAPPSKRRIDVVLAGNDVGRSSDWMVIIGYSLHPLWREMHFQQIFSTTVRTMLFCSDVVYGDIPGLLDQYGVEFALRDNEPERDMSARLAESTCFELADQKSNLLDDVKQITVQTSGVKYPCWAIRNDLFLRRVLDSFLETDEDGYPLMRVPQDWQKWLNNPSELSPIRHFTGPSYDPETGKWQRADGNIDDLYYSAMFCEAAFYIWLTQNRVKNEPPSQIGQAQKRVHRISQR